MDRAQIHTLEAFLAALLVVGALLFATQATAVTPLSASTANQHIENQHKSVAQDLLRVTAHDGTLREALLYWNSSGKFAGAQDNQSAYTGVPPDGYPLHDPLERAFGTGELAYNIELAYYTPEGAQEPADMFRMGNPSDHAVTATRLVTLYESDEISAPDQEGMPLRENPEFWAPNVESGSSVYNVVEVRITVWRM